MRVIVYTGKGGTGKSVIACATALKCAEKGKDALVISSDPAHTLADAFHKPVSNKPTKILDKLWALHVDPVSEMWENLSVLQDYLASVFSARGIDEALAYELAWLPGMTNLFALLKVEEYVSGSKFDAIILDTVASGEALRYLYFPKVMGSISKRLLKMAIPIAGVAKLVQPLVGVPTPTKEVLATEVKLIERLDRLSDILRDPSTTSVRLVTNPDAFSIENTKRALMTVSLYGINVDLAVMNKIIPEEVDHPYLKEWKDLQRKYTKQAEVWFYPLPVKKLPLFSTEVRGIKMLKECGDLLFGEEEPDQVYHQGRPFELATEGDLYIITFRLPFAEKEKCDVERIGEELVVKVKSEMGEAVNILPLPSMLYGAELFKAKLLEGSLRIFFRKKSSE